MRPTISILAIIAFHLNAFGGDSYYLNPGFKIGHTFGESGGFTIGIEVSYTIVEDRLYGVLASIDYCRSADRFRCHLGAEYLVVAMGPTLIVEDGALDLGLNITPYAGAVVIPYANYTLRFSNRHDLFELGSFLKFPILVAGDPFRIGH